MIFYLAGLQNLPESVLEAAAIDGANPFQTLIHIIFPLLRRTTLFVTTIAFLDAFQIIDHIVIITKGGPSDATNILLYYLWQLRFEYTDIGKSSALTVILIAIMLLFTITNFVLSERREEKANAK
jgi:sn-glycerol 3-phosphate transport system permease protein